MFGTSKYPLLVTHYPSKKKCILKIRKDMEVLLGISDGIVLNDIIDIPNSKSNYICADNSAGGFGWLSDHGFGSHGWVDAEMQYPVNYIRGPELRQSRLFFLKNIGISNIGKIEPPINILFSRNSSRDARRCVDFSAQIEIAKRLSSRSNRIKVQAVNFVNNTLKDQLKIVSKASIFITAAGGGSFPAFFLPFGATLIIYGDCNMHLDSDLYNNYGQFQVHWMSLSSMNEDLTLFLHLLMDEIEFLLSKSLHHNSNPDA
jgi:Glycosyltransferase 61